LGTLLRYGKYAGRINKRLGMARTLTYPEEVQLVPTNACNIRCMNCPKTWYDTDNRHLNKEVYKRVREQLFPHVSILNIQGLGEPTLSPLFKNLLDDGEEFGLHVRFVTNATMLKDELLTKIVRIGAEMTISLDGATAATHERSRPGADFPKMMEAFAKLQEQRRAQGDTGFTININTVVNLLNLDELEGILEIAGKYGVDRVTLISPGVGDERHDEFANTAIGRFPRKLAEKLPGLRAQADKYKFPLLAPEFIVNEEHPTNGNGSGAAAPAPAPFKPGKDGRLFPSKCYQPWYTIYVDVDGWVRPCCRAIWLGMGNILEQTFEEIWNGPDYQNLRRSVNSNNPPDFCRGCAYQYGINGGDEHHMDKLKAAGITLPPPPKIGVMWDKQAKQLVE
jgi:radical SAM protein with 4Fe4S-binding SPASM domain